MSPKGKIIHQQQFQNAQHTVEVIVKAKSKNGVKAGLKTKPKPKSAPFIRNCLLKTELERLVLEDRNIKSVKHNPKNDPRECLEKHPLPVDAHKKSSKVKKKHNVLPSNMTWQELLQNQNSTTSDLETNISDKDKEPIAFKSNLKYFPTHKEKISKSDLQANNAKEYIPAMGRSKPCMEIEPQTVDVSIQTSPKERNKNYLKIDSDQTKSEGGDNYLQKQGKTSINETQSPFGESALRLLHHLRERLRSKGDSEGSDMVGAIEAYFGSAERNSGNKGVHDPAKSQFASPFFPPVFSNHPPDTAKDKIVEDLQRKLSEQERKTREQEETIQELRSLSARLIAYHEQLTQQMVEERKGSHQRSHHKVDKQNDIRQDESTDLQHTLKLMKSEREGLLKEVKSQRDIILNLELKLEQKTLQGAVEKPFVRKYGENGRENSLPPLVDPTLTNERRNGGSSEDPIIRSSSRGQAGRAVLVESEIDSAFEERSSSKCSRTTVNLVNSAASVGRGNTNSQRAADVAVSGVDSATNVVIHPACAATGHTSIYEHGGRTEVDCLGVPSTRNCSLSFLSDVSGESNPRSTSSATPSERISPQGSPKKKTTPLFETPVSTASSKYLESTHVRDRGKGSSNGIPIPEETPARGRFHANLSSFSDPSLQLNPELCSKSNLGLQEEELCK